MDIPPNNQSKASILRSIAIGAAAAAVSTAFGTCFYLYRWITTGNILHLGEAVALFSVASFMGGSGGAAYHLVIRSQIKSSWKPFLAVLAAIEAYLLAFSLLAMIIGPFAPKLTEGIPLEDVRFYLALHGYGLLLCLVAFGVYYTPRIIQVIVGGIVGMLVLLSGVILFVFLFMRPNALDRWITFVQPVPMVFLSILVGLVVVSIVGWVRIFRKSRNAD